MKTPIIYEDTHRNKIQNNYFLSRYCGCLQNATREWNL